VAKFLDTPVKRYSSGMYVRLAFAVAAHLEPEILVVDEVLAVGDAGFQEKCLGKMKAVASGQGRTVLFVSHNMAAVSSLTTRAMLLEAGRPRKVGDTQSVVKEYLEGWKSGEREPAIAGSGQHTRILAVTLANEQGQRAAVYEPGKPLDIVVDLETDGSAALSLELLLLDPMQQIIGISSLHQFYGQQLPPRAGRYRYQISLRGLWLAAGRYSFDVTTSATNVRWDHYVQRAIEFDVPFSNPGGQGWDFRFEMGVGSLALFAAGAPSFSSLDAAAPP
jgi:lipopolysaccharide transport system ATP-binding protein